MKSKFFQKFLSFFLAANLLFQPVFVAEVLAEEEVSQQEVVAENSQSGSSSQNQASAESPETVAIENNNTAAVENNLEVSADAGDNSITPEPLAGPLVEETPQPTDSQATPDPSPIPSPTPSPHPSPTPFPSPTPLPESNLEQTPEPVATQSTTQTSAIAQNSQTGENSENVASSSAEQTTTIVNDNQLELENTATISATTGENTASGSGVVAESGEATAEANLVNLVNSNLVGSNFWQAVINLFGTSENDIDLTQIKGRENFDPALISVLAKNENTGDGSVNIALANFLSSFAVYNTNSAVLTNNIDLLASSGGNQILGEDGQIQTGTASAKLNLFNLVNTNLVGKNWFFGIINLFGKLQGEIILPYELQFLAENENGNPQVLAQNQNTGEGSQNQAQASLENTTEVRNTNEATLNNNISVLADTGGNSIVGEGSIQTGEAQASANLVNIVNTNIVGSRWLFLLINNFGNWTGNLLGWWGNLIITPGWTLAWVRLNGEEVDQNPQVVAANEDTGENSQDQASSQATTSLVVENNNTATVENNISLVADSGGNQVEGKEASIQTGNAQASTSVFNFINTNIIGNNWFFGIVNIFDWFLGDIIFPRPDLVINKNADKEVVKPGEEITYTINYKNQGRLWAKNTIIEDILSSRVTFVSVSGGGDYQDGKVIWNLGKVWPGGSGSFSLVIRVKADTPEGTQLVNTAQIVTTTDEPNKSNNSSSVTTLVSLTSQPSPTPTPSPTSSPTPSPVGPGPSEGGGVGGPASPQGVPVCSDTPPAEAPLLSAVAEADDRVTLTWSKAVDPVSYYLLAYGLSLGNYIYGNPNIGGPETTSYTVGNLWPGTTYYFVIRAGNGCAPGPFSNELSATPSEPLVLGLFEGLPQVLGALLPEGELLKEAFATEAAESLKVSLEEKPKPANFGQFWPVLPILILLIFFYLRHLRG